MKQVLFIGLTDYNLKNEDIQLRKKWSGLADSMDAYVIARGHGYGVKKYRVSFYLFPKVLGRLNIFIWALFALVTGFYVIATKKIDVIISQSPTTEGFVATVLAFFTRKKLVIEVHGDFIHGPFHYYHVPFEGFLKMILRWVSTLSLRRADTVRVISKATYEHVLSLAPHAHIVTFIAFTDVDNLLSVRDISWSPTIIFVGALYRIKGVHNLIEACVRMYEKFPSMRLEIYGKGPLQDELEVMARPLGSAVIFHGFRPLEEIQMVLKSSGVLVLPSLSEGLGRVLVEAGALAKPLIGSNVGGIPEIVRDGQNGFLVEAGSVPSLVNALTKILGNPEASVKMGLESRKIISEEFSTEHFFEGYRNMVNAFD